VKYLLLSLSMLLCSYTAHSLEDSEFKFLIDNIKQNKFDVVEAYLAEERATATTDPDYTVLLLNHSFNKAMDGPIYHSRTCRFVYWIVR
jgi:hypothetical protein